jgi:biotin operon repressor
MDKLDRIIAEMRETLAELRAQELRLAEAIKLLEGKAKAEPEEPKPKPKRKPAKKDTNVWNPKPETVEQVLASLIVHERPISSTALTELVPFSRDTVKRSVKLLRDQGRIRFVGKTQGGGLLYLPMPEEIEHKGGTLNGRTTA